MKTIQELKGSKVPVIIIDKKLDNTMLFPEKVEKTKNTIAKTGLPKSNYKATNGIL